MNTATVTRGLALGCGLAVCLAAKAQLPFVTPGGIEVPVPGPQDPAPTAVATVGSELFDAFLGVWQAKVDSTWYRNYKGNPYSSDPDNPAEGFVTIEYKLRNTSLPSQPAGRELSLLSIGLGTIFNSIAIGYRPDGSVPDLVAMGAAGLSLNWVWGAGGLSKGEVGATLIVHTGYKSTPILSTAAVAGGGTAQEFVVFAPVPEPTTYVGLFALGLVGFAAYRRLRV